MKNSSALPAALVLCRVGTGLATLRSLAQCGVRTLAIDFDTHSSVRFSRYASQVVHLDQPVSDEQLLKVILDIAAKESQAPVVFPTSDEHALFLAKYENQLRAHVVFSSSNYQQISQVINKSELYSVAAKAKVPTIPAIVEPTQNELVKWSQQQVAPYFVKPFYEGISRAHLHEKNLQFETRESLLDFAVKHGTDALVIQRRIAGGDGFIFDCYGYCDSQGKLKCLASHRRWRQNLPDCGATSFGEIPCGLPVHQEQILFELTEKLFSKISYHGIFGIEYLMDRSTGEFYLIDFNARPFLTISHLADCGLNLPYLAYQDLLDQAVTVASRPSLKHLFWVDLFNDIESYNEKRKKHDIVFTDWFKSLLKVRSFAYWDYKDPLPCLYRIGQILHRGFTFAAKRIFRRQPKLISSEATIKE